MDNSLTLLGLLCPHATYGYDLKHTYDRFFGMKKPLAFGQVYATISRLIRDGYIEALGDEPGEGPDRKRYAATPDGRRRIAEWMFTPDSPSPHLQSNLFAKTIVALLLDDDAESLLDLQRQEHMTRMRDLTQSKRDAPISHVLMCDHAIFHIEADLRWIDLTSARLAALRSEVLHA